MKIEGHLLGLSPAQKQRIERLSRRRVPPRQIVSHELAREISGMSRDFNRRVGLLIDRSGRIEAVSIGDAHSIGVPRKPSAPSGRMRFCTLRFVATRFTDEDLPSEELSPLALHRLDALAVVTVGEDGLPGAVRVAHLLPAPEPKRKSRSKGGARARETESRIERDV
ncbi:MAG: hypothetical protein GTO30_15190, partial [Acidobacteria bacterium]|nr:hypothetical protein [Acidobacteriota bacterium]NIQ84014.1 hypothetical protein [Acidobacteriota bacterium]